MGERESSPRCREEAVTPEQALLAKQRRQVVWIFRRIGEYFTLGEYTEAQANTNLYVERLVSLKAQIGNFVLTGTVANEPV